MSTPNNNPEGLSNKQKHSRESIDKVIKKDYNVVTEEDLEEPTEVIDRSETNEDSVLVKHGSIPSPSELETVGKGYATGNGSVGTVEFPIQHPDRIVDKKGKVVDGFVVVPDTDKVIKGDGEQE